MSKMLSSLKQLSIINYQLVISTLREFFFVNCLLLIVNCANAQIPTNTWRTHFNYLNTKGLEIVQNKVYAFSENGFFYYDKSLNQATKLSKIDGLSDAKVVQIRYDKTSQSLLVAYENGNLDLLKLTTEGSIDKIQNIDFIKNTTAIQGSRSINQIEFQGKYAYLACDFGLVELDIQKPEIKETYQNIGKNGSEVLIKGVIFANDSIFLNTNTGILGAKFSPTINLQYFGNWSIVNNSKLFQTPTYPKDPLIISPQAIKTDTDGKIWIADNQNGLLGNLSGKYVSYSPNGVFDNIKKLYYFNKFIYALGDNKLSIFQENEWKIAPKIAFSDDLIDHNGYRWHIETYGITITDDKTNKNTFLSNGFPSTDINTLAEDQDGQIWIGTGNGVAVVSASSDIFTRAVTIYTPIYQRRRLLLQEKVSKIVVDGGNRKWMGTANGIFLFSPAADELVQNFTTENSPLPSTQILDIAIDASSGEVFMATANGLLSYRGDATDASEDFGGVKIFPNPVRPEFQGELTISGLVENSVIKITDSAGRLLKETKSNGGTATWNLLDTQGNHAQTGIYFVFAVSTDGQESFVGKVAVVR